MKRIFLMAAIALCCGTLHGQEVIGTNDFDASTTNLVTTTTSLAGGLNSFSSTGDAWGIYSHPGGGPFALFDDTVNGSGGGAAFPTDTVGIAQSTKTDNFFGIVDTENGDNAGPISVVFDFDISSALGGLTSIDVDFAGMGDFEATDTLTVDYEIDGGGFVSLFTSSIDEAATKDYTMEAGNVVNLADPMSINGTEIGNSFDTISAGATGTGTTLSLRFTAVTNGGTEAIGFDNIVVNGLTTAIPEPATASIIGLIGLAGFVRRRR